jgi:Xaa-Pro aminopeptidase
MRNCGFQEGITHGLGHGLGFAYHEDRPESRAWRERQDSAGHVTSVEPGLYFFDRRVAQGGMRVEDNVVWGEKAGQGRFFQTSNGD